MSAAVKALRQSRFFDLACGAVLLAGIWAAYWPVTHFAFINLDDDDYVTANPWVKGGLSWKGAAWAFTSTQVANWHPGTWISHELDWQLYGPVAGGHHFTNVALHSANAVLLFLLLTRLTGGRGWSFLAAAFFAWHPLRVESVAWVAERKDVLSSFFGLLAMISYARYAQDGSAARRAYWGAVVFFCFSLLCKPMWVTLPCLLLLLDYWPFGRITGPAALPWRKIILEKTPFLALAAASGAVTFIVQRKAGAVLPLAVFPFEERLANALVSYLRYAGKEFWPSGLAIMYPYPKAWPPAWVAGGGAFIVVASAGAWLARRSRPWLAVGCFWFLGALFPVIGLAQAGLQAMADRYTYLPSIGLSIVAACAMAEAAARWRHGETVAAIVAILALGGCLWATSLQVAYWHDSERVFRHAIAVTEGNYIAYDNLGVVVEGRGDMEQARVCYTEALRCNPKDGLAHNNLAEVLMAKGRLNEAESQITQALATDQNTCWAYWSYYALGHLRLLQGKTELAMSALQQAISLQKSSPDARYSLGRLLEAEGKLDEAVAQYQQALRYRPDFTYALNTLAGIYVKQGRAREALPLVQQALQNRPDYADAHCNLGLVYAALNQPRQAAAEYRVALKLDPTQTVANYKLANILLAESDTAAANAHYRAALAGDTNAADAHYQFELAMMLRARGELAEEIAHFRQAIALKPDAVEALNDLGWVLAACPEARYRNGAEALDLALRAVKLTATNDASKLDTLAVAYAECGQFAEAVRTASQAQSMARSAGHASLAAEIESRMRLFERAEPFHEPPAPAARPAVSP